MRVFFTADQHFLHLNIIKYCHRPFKTMTEMDNEMTRRWNETVGPEDVVFQLGDFTLSNYTAFETYIAHLNGDIRIVPGGHDYRWLKEFRNQKRSPRSMSGRPVQLLDPLVSLEYPDRSTTKHPLVVVLCHYAMRVWDRSHYGSYHLHGHSHGTLPPQHNAMDVGVDCHDFTPVSLDDVVTDLQRREADEQAQKVQD